MADTNPSEFTVMTNAAVNLASQALAGTSKIKFTKVIGSSAVHFSDSPESIAQLTDLAPNNQTGVIKYASKEGTNQSIVQANFDELNVTTDYDLATIGLYASGDDGNEILYAVVCLQYPDHMIAGNPDTSSYYIRVVVGNTANLDVTVSPTGTVSNAQLESVLADYVKTADLQKLIDTSDYAKLKEDNEFKGNNKFDIDPTDGAGNAYAKTVDVNQQLDKKVNVADMRKPASNVAGIEEVNAKQDKIGYTPAADSKVVHNSGAEEIADQKTFDVAPIDKTTGNPYITKDGVPSDVARTGQDTNFTGKLQKSGQDVAIDSQVVHRNPDTGAVSDSVNFTGTAQKGGIDLATVQDLKSVETKAWRELSNPLNYFYMKDDLQKLNFSNATILYKIDTDNKCILANLIANVTTNETTATSSGLDIFFDLSSLIDSIKTVNSSLLVLPVKTNTGSPSYNTNIGFVGNPLDNSFSSAIVEWKIDTSGGWPGTMDEIYFSLADGFIDYGLQRTNAKFYYNNLQPGVI